MCHYSFYSDDMRKRLEYARENGCNTCMLTGNNEPQQNKDFLRVFSEINKSLRSPFLNIEMQTSGAYIDAEFLDFFKICIYNLYGSIKHLKKQDKFEYKIWRNEYVSS